MKYSRTIESRKLKMAISDDRRESKRLEDLGEKFERDKEKIEAEIVKVENAKISQEDKINAPLSRNSTN